VSVLEILTEEKFKLLDKDLRIETTRGTGPGGQHKNVTDSVVKITHIPTGIVANASSRSQHDNRKTARAVLEARVKDYFDNIKNKQTSETRKTQVGSGMRGDKIRTYREQDDQVTDHRTEKKVRLKSILAGDLSIIW
jgi:peptide chain release factor 1